MTEHNRDFEGRRWGQDEQGSSRGFGESERQEQRQWGAGNVQGGYPQHLQGQGPQGYGQGGYGGSYGAASGGGMGSSYGGQHGGMGAQPSFGGVSSGAGQYGQTGFGGAYGHQQRQGEYGQGWQGSQGYGQGSQGQGNFGQGNYGQGNYGEAGYGSRLGGSSFGSQYTQGQHGQYGQPGQWGQGPSYGQGTSYGSALGQGSSQYGQGSGAFAGSGAQQGQGWYGGSGQHMQGGMMSGMEGSATGGNFGTFESSRGLTGSARASFSGQRGKAPRGYQRSDDRLREMICERLMEDGRLDASDVEVDVKGGRVTLEGSVDSRVAKYQIEDMVESIGASDVQNNLRVTRDGGAASGRSGQQGSTSAGSSLGASGTPQYGDRSTGNNAGGSSSGSKRPSSST